VGLISGTILWRRGDGGGVGDGGVGGDGGRGGENKEVRHRST